ncbi:hypothetical protein TcasGA2_TC010865 [Tribolium castaneum]|uniref:Uncharacterized protein n=1 Tax=Tribolium castaneum TaxID=7070 RepID=D6W7P6_TRICA|nr:hypothetical protein TcasGA2_TC010865 [Tribolium castaneum]
MKRRYFRVGRIPILLTFTFILVREVRIGLELVRGDGDEGSAAEEDEQGGVEHRPWAEPAEGAALLGRCGGAGRGHQWQYIDMGLLGPVQGSPTRVVQNFCKLMTQCSINVNMLFTSAGMSKNQLPVLARGYT